MFCRTLFLIGCVFLCCQVGESWYPRRRGPSIGYLISNMESAKAEMDSKDTLKYGESCTYSDEKKRESFITDLDGIHDLETMASAMRALVRDTENRNLCDSRKMLKCQSSGKCDCSAQNDSFGQFTFTLQEGQCRLANGSNCAATDSAELECASGRSSCKIKRDGNPCTRESMYAEASRGVNLPADNFESAKAKIDMNSKKGICHCV